MNDHFTARRKREPNFDTSSNGSRERPRAELRKVVELCWICECAVWSELTAVFEELSCWSRVMNAQAADIWVMEVVIPEK